MTRWLCEKQYRLVPFLRRVLSSDRRSDCKSAWKLIGSDRRPDAVIRVYGHFGIKTVPLRHWCRSVRQTFRHRCRSVSDISAPITEVVMLVNGGSYVVDGEESLKQSTFMCRFLWIVGFEVSSVVRPCDRNFCGQCFVYRQTMQKSQVRFTTGVR